MCVHVLEYVYLYILKFYLYVLCITIIVQSKNNNNNNNNCDSPIKFCAQTQHYWTLCFLPFYTNIAFQFYMPYRECFITWFLSFFIHGGLGNEAINVLLAISKKVATQLCRPLNEVMSGIYSRLSLTLMRQNARAILSRCASPNTCFDF